MKLIDFGLAIKATDDQISDGIRIGKKPAGTGSYMAPEIIKSCCYSAKSDVWSAGVTLYALLSGTSPFGKTCNVLKRFLLMYAYLYTQIRIIRCFSEDKY